MKILLAGRQRGKTKRLIKESANTGATIVTATLAMRVYTEQMALEMNVDIPKPISAREFAKRISESTTTDERFLIDELQSVLSVLGVVLATADIDSADILE